MDFKNSSLIRNMMQVCLRETYIMKIYFIKRSFELIIQEEILQRKSPTPKEQSYLRKK
jgi:hypothetical protein